MILTDLREKSKTTKPSVVRFPAAHAGISIVEYYDIRIIPLVFGFDLYERIR